MGHFYWLNFIIALVILCLVGWLIYKVVKWIIQSSIDSSKKIKGLEQRINELEKKD